MDGFLMKPKIDFAFREIMEDGRARTGFLSAMLGIGPEQIRTTRILNPYLRKVHDDDKLGILDVRIEMNDDTEIDAEVQLSEFSAWGDRSLFYLSKMFTEQIGPGEDYGQLKKCVGISILDFKLFKGEPDFHSCFHIREDSRHFLYTDKMEFHVVELPKLPDGLGQGGSMLLWAKFIDAERKEEFDMLAGKDPYIDSAYQRLQVISQDQEKRLEYEAREKAVRDHEYLMRTAREGGYRQGREEGLEKGRAEGRKEGLEKGLEKGREEGLEKGLEKGRAEGREEGLECILTVLLEKNTPREVSEMTGQDLGYVLQVKKKMGLQGGSYRQGDSVER